MPIRWFVPMADASSETPPVRVRWVALAAAGLALVVVAAVAISRTSADSPTVGSPPAPQTQIPAVPMHTSPVFESLGAWIDIYDHAAWNHPAQTIRTMKANGVRTIYIQSSNYSHHVAFVYPGGIARYVDLAHKNGMQIVAWYLPSFQDVATEAQRAAAAIRFRTQQGEGFDGFGLDIEAPIVKTPSVRTSRLLTLSSRIRQVAGPSYPLAAIIPSPTGVQNTRGYWPGFPYGGLTHSFNAFLPMTYFTWRVKSPKGAYRYTSGNINIIRQETGDPTVPINVIGGLSNQATTSETRAFVNAIRDRRAMGASYYAFSGTTRRQWSQLARIPDLVAASGSGSPSGAGSG